ncbi:hypothetical protein [Rhizobium sp. BG4]|nr:hypothetical protein [Rhizobium sp. BG4]
MVLMLAAIEAEPYQKEPVVKIFEAPSSMRRLPATAASGQPLAIAFE